MFKISTKGDYGLLLLSALAEKMSADGGFVSLKEIAKSQNLSLPYLSQIIIPLKKAGLVISKEGKEGGYILAKKPNKITLMEILEVLEGPVSPVRCCSAGKTGRCGKESRCNVKAVWLKAKFMLIDFLKSKTLSDIINV